MAHVPHLVVSGPLDGLAIPLDADHLHHLGTVLRRAEGAPVTYTDGSGLLGEGMVRSGTLVRGTERRGADRARLVTLAVAPPRAADRARFVVEKCTELGVTEIVWLRTRHGGHRPPSNAKVGRWVMAAVEQSRGAWIPAYGSHVEPTALEGEVVAAVPDGRPWRDGPWSASTRPIIVAIGPEGGFADDEIPPDWGRLSLGASVLRTETAAVVAAALALAQ